MGNADIIKRIVREFLQNESMADLAYATYTGAGLKIDSKPEIIPLDMVVVPKHLQEIEAELTFTVSKTDRNKDGALILGSSPEIDSITINKLPVRLNLELKAGDRVAVLQKRGGQKYAIIDRM